LDLNVFDAVLFDKDGTLFDFQQTWAPWAQRMIAAVSEGDQALVGAISQVLGFDYERCLFEPDSMSVACTPDEQVVALMPVLPHMTAQDIRAHLTIDKTNAVPIPVRNLVPTLEALRKRGMRLAVVTNDFQGSAHTQLEQAGIDHFFDVVIGFDSGHGGKPAPDGCLAAAQQLGVAPRRSLMVGDSLHDIDAGRAAGMATLGVLTGTASREDLAPHADSVVPDISQLLSA
jgi:phosphoglycolate phosphatase